MPNQFHAWSLPSGRAKHSGICAETAGDFSMDHMRTVPTRMRGMVQAVIERFLPAEKPYPLKVDKHLKREDLLARTKQTPDGDIAADQP